jgi:hypothetical protein
MLVVLQLRVWAQREVGGLLAAAAVIFARPCSSSSGIDQTIAAEGLSTAHSCSDAPEFPPTSGLSC